MLVMGYPNSRVPFLFAPKGGGYKNGAVSTSNQVYKCLDACEEGVMLLSMTSNREPMDLAQQNGRGPTAKTVEMLAEMLCISYKTLYAAIKRNSPPAIRVAGTIRLDPQQTAEWLRARSTSTKPAMRRAA